MKKAGSGFRLFHFLYGILVVTFLLTYTDSLQAKTNQDSLQTLVQGVPIQRELAEGTTHQYQVTLLEKQYVKLTADQRDVDVTLSILDANGKTLISAENNRGDKGFEYIIWQSPASGMYSISVTDKAKSRIGGRYILRLDMFDESPLTIKAFENYLESRPLYLRGQERSDKAAVLLKKSLEAWRELKERQIEAFVLQQLGVLYIGGNNDIALEYYRQALPLYSALEMKAEEARTLNSIAALISSSGKIRDGLNAFLQVLPLIHYLSPNNEYHLLNQLGHIYFKLGDYEQSQKFYDRVMTFARNSKDKQLEVSTLITVSQQYLAMDYISKALENIEGGIQLAREIKSFDSEGEFLKIRGGIAVLAGNLEEAMDYFKQAAVINSKARKGARFIDIQKSIADINFAQGKIELALEEYKTCLELYEKVGALDTIAKTKSCLGYCYAKMGEYEKSDSYFKSALEMARNLNDKWLEVQVLSDIAEVMEEKGDLEKTELMCQEGLNLARILNHSQGESMFLSILAKVSIKKGNLKETQKYYESSFNILLKRRTRFGISNLKETFGVSLNNLSNSYINILLNSVSSEDAEKAFLVNESAKARGLLEKLTDWTIDLRDAESGALIAKRQNLQRQLNFKANAVSTLIGDKQNFSEAVNLNKEINTLTENLQLLDLEIRKSNPSYAALTQPQIPKFEEIQNSILDESTVLLEFALGESQSWLFAVTKTGIRAFKLPAEKQINESARKFYEALTARESATDFAGIEQKINTSGADLSRLILAPISKQLSSEWKGKRLAIVASGALEYVPFGALPEMGSREQGTGNSKNLAAAFTPLISNHEIVNLPSASVLGVIRQEIAARKSAPRQLAVFADPVFEKDDPRFTQAKNLAPKETPKAELTSNVNPAFSRAMRDFDSKRDQLGRLTFSRQEAEAIASMTTKDQSLQRVSFAANRTNAMSEELSQYRIIHFATHGLLNSEHPELSGLVFSMLDEQGKPQDGFLRLHDIYNLKLPADLVVLSACQTALGKEVKGEGLIGLTRGFMYAGAPRVVASLWRVNDYATAELMKRFYAGMLKENLPAAAALRAAQLGMMKQKRFSSPYYWAAFTIQGEWK